MTKLTDDVTEPLMLAVLRLASGTDPLPARLEDVFISQLASLQEDLMPPQMLPDWEKLIDLLNVDSEGGADAIKELTIEDCVTAAHLIVRLYELAIVDQARRKR